MMQMEQTSELDRFLDAQSHWSRELTVNELYGVDKEASDDSAGVIGIEELNKTWKVTYRLINTLNLAAHRPFYVQEYLTRNFSDTVQVSRLGTYEVDEQVCDMELSEYVEVERGAGGFDYVNRQFLYDVADVVCKVEGRDLEYDSVGRVAVRPHRRLLRLNESLFNIHSFCLHPHDTQVYVGAGKPVKLTKMSAATGDALEW